MNRPSVEEAIDYFRKNGADYTAREVRDVWNSFEATVQDGTWFFGQRPVGDWRFAMETRLSDNRKKRARKHRHRPPARLAGRRRRVLVDLGTCTAGIRRRWGMACRRPKKGRAHGHDHRATERRPLSDGLA
jgi:hypothetical protein